MPRLEIETSLGPVWLWGSDTGRPVLLVIHGAFAELEALGQIQINGMDVFQAHLPGNHCPAHASTNLGAWAVAYREAIERTFPNRGIVLFGISTGALLGLAMRSKLIRRMILIEPPLRPSRAWPLRLLRTQAPAWGAEFIWQLFGVGPDRFEERDFSHLLRDLKVPAIVIVGDLPLDPPRAMPTMPTLIDDETRAELEAHPCVDLWTALGVGHNIPRDAKELLLRAVVETRAAEVPEFAGRA